MKFSKDFVKGIAVALVVAAVLFSVLWAVAFKRTVAASFQAVDAYIAGCQQAGVLPTVDQLKARLDELAKGPQQPAQPEGKK